MRTALRPTLTACAVALTSLGALAGSLTPPPGAPTGSMKTLQEVEPRTPISSLPVTISQPGSYYLTASLTFSVAAQDAITVNADGVTIDLMGFTISGNNTSQHAINSPGSNAHLSVVNGTIRNFLGRAVNSPGSGGVVQSLRATENNNGGITLGPGATVRDCVMAANQGTAFNVGAGSTLLNCAANANAGNTGFICGAGSTLQNCASSSNSTGFNLGAGTTATSCSVSSGTGGHGFITGDSCSLSTCSVGSVTGLGTHGYLMGNGCVLTGCIAGGAGQHGFLTGSKCLLTGCIAHNQGNDAFQVGSGSVVSNCLAGANINGQTIGRGFFTSGSDCRFEGCTAVKYDKGFENTFASGGNIYLRNTATGCNTAYNLNANNFFGTIITTSAAFNTNTNPNANVSY